MHGVSHFMLGFYKCKHILKLEYDSHHMEAISYPFGHLQDWPIKTNHFDPSAKSLPCTDLDKRYHFGVFLTKPNQKLNNAKAFMDRKP